MRMNRANHPTGAILDNKVEEKDSGKTNGEISLRDELLTRTHTFLEVLNSTIQQLQIQGIYLSLFFNLQLNAFNQCLIFLKS